MSTADFVTFLYNSVFQRDPDAVGLAHWTGLGWSKEDLVEGISRSTEFVNIAKYFGVVSFLAPEVSEELTPAVQLSITELTTINELINQ